MKEISFGHVLLGLFQTAQRFNMEVQPQLVLLQKTLLNIEGLGRQLYPDLDLWRTAKPFLEQWMEDQIGARAMLRNMKDDLPYLLEKLPEMPGLIYNATKRIADGGDFEKLSEDMMRIQYQLKRNNRRTVLTISGAGLLLSGLLLFGFNAEIQPAILGVPVLTWLLSGAGSIMLLLSLYDID